MNFKKSVCCLLAGAAFVCAAQQINPITRAMLDGYTELINENPKDYQSLYERAAQYYQLSLYDQALNDLTRALKYTPEKEKDFRLAELNLLADVATETGDYELALKSINDALAIEPSNYAGIYKKGNILLHLNRPEEAYRTFSSMQSLKSRSQEAYFGMAKACIQQKNFDEAKDLMKEAEAAAPTASITYSRIGDLYNDMEMPQEAATNYLIAFNLGDDSGRPLESLIELAEKNYPAVDEALNFVIEKSDNKMTPLFLKGNIALESGNYSQAESAFEQLLQIPQAESAGVYAQAARAKLALGKADEAVKMADEALNLEEESEPYVTKTYANLAQGNNAQALMDATTGVSLDLDKSEAHMARAEAMLALKDYKSAIDLLNNIVMVEPDNMAALMLRAYANEAAGNPLKNVMADYNRVTGLDALSFPDTAIKGIAKYKTGKKLDADAIVEQGLAENSDKDALYWAAVYYAQTGDLEKAKELADKAIYEGFQNQYLLKQSSTPGLNLAPIRHLLK